MSFGEGHHWISETVAPTGVQPTMITRRGTAATSISFRKPDWRSHSSTMPEKMELNRTVMPMTSGARNCMLLPVPDRYNTGPNPNPRARRYRVGCPSDATICARERRYPHMHSI